jgi:hypothetical protein
MEQAMQAAQMQAQAEQGPPPEGEMV